MSLKDCAGCRRKHAQLVRLAKANYDLRVRLDDLLDERLLLAKMAHKDRAREVQYGNDDGETRIVRDSDAPGGRP